MSFDQRGFYQVTGKKIKEYRNRANKTQDDIANILGITRANYANIETGRQRAPLDIIWRLSIEYGQPIEKLIPEPASKKVTEEYIIEEDSKRLNISIKNSSTSDEHLTYDETNK